MHIAAISILQFFFAPHGQPWWAGAVWGNVVAIIPCGILGWLWSKTKFWPLNLIHSKLDGLHEAHKQSHEHLEALHQKMDLLHEKHDRLHDKHEQLLAKHDLLLKKVGDKPS